MVEPPAGVIVEGSRVPGRRTVLPRFQGAVMPMTEEQRAGKIRALVEERRGYVARGLPDRVAQVDAALRELGAEGVAPAQRAEKRPSRVKGEKRA